MSEGSGAVMSRTRLIPTVQSSAVERLVVLSERETNVLQLLSEGLDTVEVGRRLFCSERTVKNVVHAVTSRLKLRNRTQAVAYGLWQGWI